MWVFDAKEDGLYVSNEVCFGQHAFCGVGCNEVSGALKRGWHGCIMHVPFFEAAAMVCAWMKGQKFGKRLCFGV